MASFTVRAPVSVKTAVGDISSAAVGDAAATVTLPGGKVWGCLVQVQDSSGTRNSAIQYSVSATSGIITVTIYLHEAVTLGQFIIWYS